MKIIKEICEMIEEELEGAEQYAEHAAKWKQENPALAKMFYDISLQEMTHVNILHSEVSRMIEQHKREHGDPPADMMAVYEYVHEKHIKKANAVKMYQAQYRGE